jgi:hypothetical protein
MVLAALLFADGLLVAGAGEASAEGSASTSVGPARRDAGAVRHAKADLQGPSGPEGAVAASKPAAPARVRIAMGSRAAERLPEQRLRRLVAIQLAGVVEVAPEPNGPLDEPTVRVFVELDEPRVATVQVQGAGRRLDARTVDLEGLPWDVAMRFIAIGVSEAVRAQLSPVRRPRPKPPTEEEILEGLAQHPSVELRSALVGHYVGASDDLVAGSRIALAVRQPWLDFRGDLELVGSLEGQPAIGLGVGARRSVWVDPAVRLELGAGLRIAMGDSTLPKATEPVAVPWLVAHAALGGAARIDDATWLTLELEPGLSFAPESRSAGPSAGIALGISFDGR